MAGGRLRTAVGLIAEIFPSYGRGGGERKRRRRRRRRERDIWGGVEVEEVRDEVVRSLLEIVELGITSGHEAEEA